MPVFKPFRAFRPSTENAKMFASRPFDVVKQAEADSENEKGLSQFLKVTRPELFKENLSTEACHEESKQALDTFINSSLLAQDEKECYYLYGQTLGDRTQYGIIGCISTDDYKNGLIKQHELTQVEKVSDKVNHIIKTGFHTEPVFTAVEDNLDLELIIQDCLFIEPEYNFVSSDGITHQFWPIVNEAKIRRLQYVFENDISAIYIADGHHRSAAASIVANELGTETSKLFPAAVFPMKQLQLKGYHRLVEMDEMSIEVLLDKLRINFTVQETGSAAVYPADQKSFGLFAGGVWYKLTVSKLPEGVSEASSVFNRLIATDIFAVENIRTSNKIEYVGGRSQVEAIVSGERDIKNEVLFTLCPLDISLLFKLSDAGYILPPKSTWFEPKLRSGLFLHSLVD